MADEGTNLKLQQVSHALSCAHPSLSLAIISRRAHAVQHLLAVIEALGTPDYLKGAPTNLLLLIFPPFVIFLLVVFTSMHELS